MGIFTRNTSTWPVTFATLDEICVDGAVVEASGAYTVDGEYYTASLEREFRSARDAESWAQVLEAQPQVTIKYDPNKPEKHQIESLPS